MTGRFAVRNVDRTIGGLLSHWVAKVHGAAGLRVGDRVWMRHAKAGELCERFNELHLVRGEELVGVVPTYRGEGEAFL